MLIWVNYIIIEAAAKFTRKSSKTLDKGKEGHIIQPAARDRKLSDKAAVSLARANETNEGQENG